MMDEPFGALDAMTRQSLQDEMLEIARATKATIFFVTHDLEEAIYLGDRVIGLMPHPGRIGIELSVDLPRPRDQVTTRESPEFLRLRHKLYDFIHASEARRTVVNPGRALALPAALVVLAEIGARAHGPSDSIAPPSQVASALLGALADGSLAGATRDTLVSAFGGLAIGAGLGLALGVMLGSLAPARPADGADDRTPQTHSLGRGHPDRPGRARLRLSAGNRDRRLRLRLAAPGAHARRGPRRRAAADRGRARIASDPVAAHGRRLSPLRPCRASSSPCASRPAYRSSSR